jgi:hypothetical protein
MQDAYHRTIGPLFPDSTLRTSEPAALASSLSVAKASSRRNVSPPMIIFSGTADIESCGPSNNRFVACIFSSGNNMTYHLYTPP